MKAKPFYGTGLGGYGKPTQGLGLETLGLQFATIQMARDNNQDSILWHLGTEGYGVTSEQRDRTIGEMSDVADKINCGMSKLKVLDTNGQWRSPHFAGLLPCIPTQWTRSI
ncbi:MAG: hypothetical protein FWE16_02085 [Firmicutes bacterium]|nr:hypothetical protein [Bacillota bacterium]